MAEIFVVDDSKMQAKAIARILQARGHEVTCIDSGEECVRRTQEEFPDLIVMDVVMPGMNGFQATREITRNKFTEHIPILLLSGKSQETDRAWGRRQGARGYLVKPVEEEELCAEVDKLLAASQ